MSIKEEPHEQQQVGRGGKHKPKAYATPTPSIPAKVFLPLSLPPPSAPMPQTNKNNADLYLNDLALTFSPPQVVIASTPSNFIFQFQHVLVEASDGSNINKVFIFVENESISNMLENGTIDNPMLMFAFEFVKNVSELEHGLFTVGVLFLGV